MDSQTTNRQWETIEVSIKEFRHRMNELMTRVDQPHNATPPVSVYSRLAVVHQVAKAFALDALQRTAPLATDVDIEELTDPPLYDQELNDEPVIIQFSFRLEGDSK